MNDKGHEHGGRGDAASGAQACRGRRRRSELHVNSPLLSFPVARVVYAKRPFAGPKAVLAYLARYTRRVAISNSRLVTLDEAGVTFKWKILWAMDSG
jgi:Putative transposase